MSSFGLARVASAGHVVVPEGWQTTSRTTSTAEVYVPRGDLSIELVVAATTQRIGPDGRGEVTRAALDAFHGMARRAALTGKIAEDEWRERTDPTAKLVEATLAWHEPGAQVEVARLVITGDATQLTAVTGECIARDDTRPASLAACKAALATLDPGVPLAARIVPSIAPEGTNPDRPLTGPIAPVHVAPSMSEGTHTPLPPIAIAQEPSGADRRPVFIGGGIVLLAAAFWWNMRRRARHELEDQENHDDR